jgi:hypothetical protein
LGNPSGFQGLTGGWPLLLGDGVMDTNEMALNMADDHLELDPEAKALFEQFGGIESWKTDASAMGGGNGLAESLRAEQIRLDSVRILLVQMAHLISRYLADDTFAGGSREEAEVFEELSRVIQTLAGQSGHLGCAFIRYRGAPSDPEFPEKFDYEIMVGATVVDSLMAPRVAKRNSELGQNLPEMLMEAFRVFAQSGINNIYIALPDDLPRQLSSVQLCLKILSGFRTARRTGADFSIGVDGRQQRIAVVNDENMYPDPNLTLLAGLNKIQPKAMERLVEKVDALLRRQEKRSSLRKYAGVYNAALELPKLKAQLKPPPVEMNNIKWLIAEEKEDSVTLEKVFVAQLAMESAATAPQKVAKMINSVYGDDYARINKQSLSERLGLSSDLLAVAEKRDHQAKLKNEVLGNLHERLDQVKDNIIDEVDVREDTDGARTADQPAAPDVVDSRIYRMVDFFKKRSATRKKMVGMVHAAVEFTQQNYDVLAKDFRITSDQAKGLIQILKGCFDENGRFLKKRFIAAIDNFKEVEQKVFAFLWHHMKDVILPEDRVSFLNSLQTLTAQMKLPKQAFKVLLEDLCSEPDKLQFSDNKAVMLANLIVHRSDKSLADYEITPEDIILNPHNLDPVVVEYAAWRIDKDREQFFGKVQTVHNKLAEALTLGKTREKQIPAPVVLNLERELYIFLSMVQCETGAAILRSAVHEYGNPKSAVYHHKMSGDMIGGILQNLRVALRGVGTVGGMQDIGMLKGVKEHNEDFQRLKNDRIFRTQAKKVTEWADEAIKFIKFRS